MAGDLTLHGIVSEHGVNNWDHEAHFLLLNVPCPKPLREAESAANS